MHQLLQGRLGSLLVLVLCSALLASLQANAQATTGVSLDTPQVWRQSGDNFEDGKDRWGSPLSMELSRQAILIAARDELGLRTFDASLGEPAELPGVKALTLKLDMISREGSQIGLLDGEQRLLDHMIKTDWFVHPEQPRTIVRHEAFSRAQAVDALKQAGLVGEPNQWLDDAPVPEAIQALADEMSLISQFRAARALHKLIAEEGESPKRLWTLSRVYANLGQESRWFIRCQFAAFQARSLLYAQRLRAKAPQHALGHLSVAYAWTMATYTRNGGEALDQFEQMGQAAKPWADWGRLVRACCRYDQAALDDLIVDAGPQAPIAGLWGAVTNEFVGLRGLTFKSIERAMDVNPLSTRNLYSGYDAMGVSAGHWLTEAAPNHFAIVTAVQLSKIDQAPDAIKPIVNADPDKPMQLKQLAQTAWAMQDLTAEGKDPDELSYAILGTLMDEANALHILYRAKFMRRQWGVDTTGYLREVSPALARHPFRPLILTFLLRPNTRNKTVADLMAVFDPGYINPLNLSTFIWNTPNDFTYANGMTETDWWRLALGMDWMSGTDWLYAMRWYYSDSIHLRGKYAGNMRAYDPHHPKRIALRIQYMKLNEKTITRLIKEYGYHAIVADALAAYKESKGNLQAARDFAELAAMAAPERKTVERLARIQLLLGDEAKWLAAMKRILKLPDHSLDHASINQTIANTYMNQGRFEEALPYSKASADSWAAWAMNTYIINLAVLGRHDEAKAIGRRVNERYGRGYFAEEEVQLWTGRADADAMIKTYEKYYKQQAGNKRSEYVYHLLYVDLQLSAYERALERVIKSVELGDYNSRDLLFGVVAAQLLGQDQSRDKLLGLLINYKFEGGKRVRFSLLGDLMKQGLEAGRIDWQAAAKWTKEHDEGGFEVAVSLGVFALELPVDRERAIAGLLALAKQPDYNGPLTNIARTLLRKEGYTNEQMLPTGFAGHAFLKKGLQ